MHQAVGSLRLLVLTANCLQPTAYRFSGDCIGRVTPVPIPNTAVKPTGADDTASFRCGKVGSRRIYIKEARFTHEAGFFVCYNASMNSVETLKETEKVIAGLSKDDRKRLFNKFAFEANDGIEKNQAIMGGTACIRKTRIPVWLLYRARQLGLSESGILASYPGLTAEDLVNAWHYADLNHQEIESQIEANERED